MIRSLNIIFLSMLHFNSIKCITASHKRAKLIHILTFLLILHQFSYAQISSKLTTVSVKRTKAESVRDSFLVKANTAKLSIVDGKDRFEHYSVESGLSSGLVFQILQDKFGFLWFATQNGLDKFDAYNFSIYENDPDIQNSISYNDVSCLVEYKGKLWAGTWGGGINKFDGVNNFSRYRFSQSDTMSICDNRIQFMFCDHLGTLWISTPTGLNKYVPSTNLASNRSNGQEDQSFKSSGQAGKDRFERYLLKQKMFTITEDKSGNLYFGSTSGLFVLGNDRKTFLNFKLPVKENNSITALCVDHNGTIWTGNDKGLYQFDIKTGKFTLIKLFGYSLNNINRAGISCIFEDNYFNIWVGTNGLGLFKYEPNNKQFISFTRNISEQFGIVNYDIYDIKEDNTGVLWVTSSEGIFKLDLKPAKFQNYPLNFITKKFKGQIPAYCFAEDRKKNLWIGSLNGIVELTPDKKNSRYIALPDNGTNSGNINVNAVFAQEDGNSKIEGENVWIGSTERGLLIYSPAQKQFVNDKGSYSFTKEMIDSRIFSIVKDSKNNIWLASSIGLYLYDTRTNQLSLYKNITGNNNSTSKQINLSKSQQKIIIHQADLTSDVLRLLYIDKEGILWIGTDDSGLNRFDYSKNEFMHFRSNQNGKNTLTEDVITSIYDDYKYVWVGTTNGLNRIDKKTFQISRYSKKDGFSSKYIFTVISDYNNNPDRLGQASLWLSTNNGLSRFVPSSKSITNFNGFDGLSNISFIHSAVYKSSSGEIFFGTRQGFISFHPENISYNKNIPPVYLTNFQISGKEKNFDTDLASVKEIILDHNQNFIEFEFSALDYTSPYKNQYKYMLDGVDHDWISTGTRRNANYTDLRSGSYILKIIGSNSDGYWNTQGLSIKLVITPPFWETLWFRSSLAAILFVLVLSTYKIKVNNIEKRKMQLEDLNVQLIQENKERQRAELESRTAKEIAENANKLKSEFLAQVSHEIRTPVNAILNFAGLIKEDIEKNRQNASFEKTEVIEEGFPVIERAGKRLIRTVELILNMSLLQTETFELNFNKFDLYKNIIYGKIQEYMQSAQDKGLKFNVYLDTDDFYVYADDSTVEQIFDNLLNNAVKFTNKGSVGIRLFRNEINNLVIEVFDTGIGISKKYLAHLFQPFSQEEGGYARRFDGNGLGLALTKKFIELNNATIEVHSEKDLGSKFVVTFPKPI